jgi:hypothetical protein
MQSKSKKNPELSNTQNSKKKAGTIVQSNPQCPTNHKRRIRGLLICTGILETSVQEGNFCKTIVTPALAEKKAAAKITVVLS